MTLARSTKRGGVTFARYPDHPGVHVRLGDLDQIDFHAGADKLEAAMRMEGSTHSCPRHGLMADAQAVARWFAANGVDSSIQRRLAELTASVAKHL